MLEVNSLSYRYSKGKTVLKNVSFSLKEGGIAVILGQNGSGKSTLIKCLVGENKPKEGAISFEGKPLPSPRERSRLFSYVPQSPSLPPLSVYDAILMGRLPLFGISPRKEDREITVNLIRRFALEELSFQRADMLSGGEAQKVMIARAMATSPKAIFLDEPTANLDVANQLLVMEAIEALAKEGILVVIAMHDVNLALRIGKRFLLMKKGELFKDIERDSIDPETLGDLFGVKAEIVEIDGRKQIYFGGKPNEDK